MALAILKERGIVDTRYRVNYAASTCVHLDARTEYFALAENGRAHHDSIPDASAATGTFVQNEPTRIISLRGRARSL